MASDASHPWIFRCNDLDCGEEEIVYTKKAKEAAYLLFGKGWRWGEMPAGARCPECAKREEES